MDGLLPKWPLTALLTFSTLVPAISAGCLGFGPDLSLRVSIDRTEIGPDDSLTLDIELVNRGWRPVRVAPFVWGGDLQNIYLEMTPPSGYWTELRHVDIEAVSSVPETRWDLVTLMPRGVLRATAVVHNLSLYPDGVHDLRVYYGLGSIEWQELDLIGNRHAEARPLALRVSSGIFPGETDLQLTAALENSNLSAEGNISFSLSLTNIGDANAYAPTLEFGGSLAVVLKNESLEITLCCYYLPHMWGKSHIRPIAPGESFGLSATLPVPRHAAGSYDFVATYHTYGVDGDALIVSWDTSLSATAPVTVIGPGAMFEDYASKGDLDRDGAANGDDAG